MGALASRRPARRPGLSAVFSTRTCGPILTGWTFQSSLGIEAKTLFPRANLVSVVFVPSWWPLQACIFYPGLLPSC